MGAIAILVGTVGFGLHVAASLSGPAGLRENLLYGPPVFSPLLFTNLALLAGIAAWVLYGQNRRVAD